MRTSIAGPNDTSGAKFTSALIRKHWRFGQSMSPEATDATHQCCPNYWPTSPQIRRFPALQQLALTISESTMMLMPILEPMRSYHPRKDPKPWKATRQARSHATKRCWHRNTSTVRYSNDRADTSTEAATKPRCILRNSWVSVSRHQTSTVSSQSSRFVSSSLTASQRTASLSRRSRERSVRRKGQTGRQVIFTTEPL